MPSEITMTLRNFRLWLFASPADGSIHFAVPDPGILHTFAPSAFAKTGSRELYAQREISERKGACLAHEQFEGG